MCMHIYTYVLYMYWGTSRKIDSNTLTVGDFNIPLSTMDRSSKQRINKGIVALNDRSNVLNWYIQNQSPQRSKIYILFKCTWNVFKDRPHGIHKTSLNKFKKIEIILSCFLDHNGLKLETNLSEKTKKHSSSWRLNNMLLNNAWDNNEIKDEIKKFLETK